MRILVAEDEIDLAEALKRPEPSAEHQIESRALQCGLLF